MCGFQENELTFGPATHFGWTWVEWIGSAMSSLKALLYVYA